MGNKKSLIKLLTLVAVVLGFGCSYTAVLGSSFSIELPGGANFYDFYQGGAKGIVPIKFVDHGNDFGGFMYISQKENKGDGGVYRVEFGSDVYECETQVRGWYYNAERGERLRPLDDKSRASRDNTDFTVNDGIYTSCRRAVVDGISYEEAQAACEEDNEACNNEVKEKYQIDRSYHGMVVSTFQGEDFVLGVGIKYDTGGVWIEPSADSKLSTTLVDIEDILVGFVYDNDGGIGLAGCDGDQSEIRNILNKLSEKELRDLFEEGTNDDGKKILVPKEDSGISVTCDAPGSAGGSLLGLVVEGIVGLNKDKLSETHNTSDKKMQYFYGVSVNNATLINYTKQKAETLCRGRWKSLSDIVPSNENVVCIRSNEVADPINADAYSGKTLIVQNGNVIVHPVANANETGRYDIFVDKGNLIINESDAQRFVFNNVGFIDTEKTIAQFNTDVANGFNSDAHMYTGSDVAVASLLKGNFIVNGYVVASGGAQEGKLNNKYFLYGKFTSKDSYDELKNTFAWTCSNESKGSESDKPWCPASCDAEGCPIGVQHAYQQASLIVIDQNYESPLYW